MKSETHDAQMADVYGHIYNDFYDFKPAAMQHASEIISNNLTELGINKETLAELNVLNIGTGREALVFHKLGARKVFHFDLSITPVRNLEKLSCRDGFGNIKSKRADICEIGELGLDKKINLVYLSGVLHHLHAAGIAVKNIKQSLKPSARLFFRIYRSGSLAFFVVDFIRRIVNYDDFDLTSKLAAEKFGETEDPTSMYSDIVDDFFLPVLKLYDPRQLDEYFENNGFQVFVKRPFVQYNNANTGSAGQGWSLYYKYLGGDATQISINDFPGHIDQLHGIAYTESFINKTIGLMDKFLAGYSKCQRRTESDLLCVCTRQVKHTGSSRILRQKGTISNFRRSLCNICLVDTCSQFSIFYKV